MLISVLTVIQKIAGAALLSFIKVCAFLKDTFFDSPKNVNKQMSYFVTSGRSISW